MVNVQGSGSGLFTLFSLFLFEELPVLGVSAEQPVPPEKTWGIVPHKVLVMKVMGPNTFRSKGGREGGGGTGREGERGLEIF